MKVEYIYLNYFMQFSKGNQEIIIFILGMTKVHCPKINQK